jgi:phage-related protein
LPARRWSKSFRTIAAILFAVYTVKFETAIYILYAFQKKSKSGRMTPTVEIDLISRRLKTAQADDLARLRGEFP